MKSLPAFRLSCFALCLALMPFVSHPAAMAYDEVQKLLASDGAADDRLGAVSVRGDVAVLGASGADVFAGVAYVYRFDGSTWVEEQKLTASDGNANDFFGGVVAVDGDVALVTASGDDDNGSSSGSVYMFRFDGSMWVEEQKLTASDGAVNDGFGRSAALFGDVAIIGSYLDDDNGSGSGSAYVFRYDGSTWVEEQKLLASDGQSGDVLGSFMTMKGDLAIIGAPDDDDNGINSGSAYVFRFDGSMWVEEQKLTPADGQERDNFGSSMSVDGDVACVGSTGDDDGGSSTGSAYVFRFDGSTWVEEQKLTASDASDFALFGGSVAVDNDVAWVAAPNADSLAGAVYEFSFDGAAWVEDEKLTASDAAPGSFFGRPISLDGGTLMIGANADDENGTDSGAVYVFIGELPCQQGTINAAAGSSFNVLFVDGSSGGEDRTVEIQDGDLISVTIVKPGAGGNGKFVLHANEGEPTSATQSPLPFSIGTTCFAFLLGDGAAPVIVANNLGRTDLVGSSEYFGTPWADPDTADVHFFYPDVPVGTVLTFQGIIVDPGTVSPRGVSATNAVILKVMP